MNKLSWGAAAAIAAIGALAGVVACSSSSSSGYKFPFSGPSCNGGPPGSTANAPTACDTCEENACGGTADCLSTDCSAYFNCLCACQPTDTTCLTGCPQPTAQCMTCEGNISSCAQQADQGSCKSQCTASTSSSSGGTTSSSSGGSTGSSSGTTATGSCAQLLTCCSMFPAQAQSSCTGLASANDQQECQIGLTTFQDAGLCQ